MLRRATIDDMKIIWEWRNDTWIDNRIRMGIDRGIARAMNAFLPMGKERICVTAS